jgi:F-box domain
MFFAMPTEIQVQILCYLEATDILSLRITSKPLSELLQINASTISRVVLRNSSFGDVPTFHEKLYAPPPPVENLDYFLQMMHREKIVLRMVSTIADYVQIKIYRVKTAARRKHFAPGRARMERRLKAPAFVIYHFLERFRAAQLRRPGGVSSDGQHSSAELRPFDDKIQAALIKCYSEDVLLPAFQFYRIMVSAYRQKLRPPAYAGTIERKLRGWDRTPPSDLDVAQVLMYGGMEEVLEIMLHSTYGARLQALNVAVGRINGRSPPVGLRWRELPSDLQITRDLDTSPVSNNQLLLQGRDSRLAGLYLPWLFVMVARHRAIKDTGVAEVDPHVTSPFAYIADLLKDQETGAISGETVVTVEDFVARANAPDEDEEHTEADVPTEMSGLDGPMPRHRSLSLPTLYG